MNCDFYNNNGIINDLRLQNNEFEKSHLKLSEINEQRSNTSLMNQ